MCVNECEEGFRGKRLQRRNSGAPRWRASALRNADRLDDLEDCRTAHHEDEQRQQPRTHGVLLLGVLRRLGHVSALGDVAAGLLVGHADSLLRGHCAFVCCCCWEVGLRVQITRTRRRKSRANRCSKSKKRKLLFCAELLFRTSEIVQVLFSLVFFVCGLFLPEES